MATNYENVTVELDDGIAWVTLDRPEKRNAMNPALNAEMVDVLLGLDANDECGVVVLTGAGDSFSAGMDLKEYFREVDEQPEHVQRRVRRDSNYWQWRLLRTYPKPTIAMVNGWCFGGAFTPLCACDLAVAADEATFGLSEINWGIPPGSLVSRGLAETVGGRAALLYIMTGRTFDGRKAAELGLVNWSVPRERLRDEVESLARELLEKNPVVLRAAKLGFKHAQTMSWDTAEDYLYAKLEQSQFLDRESGREQGLAQFLDDKSIRPGLESYKRTAELSERVGVQALCEHLEDGARQRGVLLRQPPELAVGQDEECARLRGCDGRRPRRAGDQRDLAEEVAGAERRDLRAVLRHLDPTGSDGDELVRALALADELHPRRHVDQVGRARDRLQLVAAALREERDRLDQLVLLVAARHRAILNGHVGKAAMASHGRRRKRAP